MMLFALFFGAGNMIFPPAMGQAAGTAAAMSTPLAKVNIKALQEKLRANKVILSYPY